MLFCLAAADKEAVVRKGRDKFGVILLKGNEKGSTLMLVYWIPDKKYRVFFICNGCNFHDENYTPPARKDEMSGVKFACHVTVSEIDGSPIVLLIPSTPFFSRSV